MSTEQHESLRIADHPGTSYSAAEMLRASHALIVQMAEALQKLACLGNGQRAGNSIGNLIAQEALEKTGATQYLKGPKT